MNARTSGRPERYTERAVGKYQKATMWAAGTLLGLGFVGDAIDYFLFENPSEISVEVEVGWTLLFLLTVAAIEGLLWLVFSRFNVKTTNLV